MLSELWIGARVILVMSVLTGMIYPLLTTGAAQLLFHSAANGSLVVDDKGNVVGSQLIGQVFTNPGYFQGRPSAAGTGYDAGASGGSNFGPTSKKLRERIEADVQRLRRENPKAEREIPDELVMASGSGLDPHLSPAAVQWQIARVAQARSVTQDRVQRVVDDHVAARELGFLGEPRINVLMLNLALDAQFGRPLPAKDE